MNVFSNVASMSPAEGIRHGNIELWQAIRHAPQCGQHPPDPNAEPRDGNPGPLILGTAAAIWAAGYGSMQIHNFGAQGSDLVGLQRVGTRHGILGSANPAGRQSGLEVRGQHPHLYT